MKKTVRLLMLFLGFYTQAQNNEYLPMAIDDAHWVVYGSNDDYSSEKYYGFYTKGDTIINGINYKKVYYISYINTVQPLIKGYQELVAAIRDDIPSKQVYGIFFPRDYELYGLPTPDTYCTLLNHEYLLYDFDKQIGDIYNDNFANNFCAYEGSVNIYDIQNEFIYGQERKLLKLFDYWSINVMFIEGVGYSKGPFYPVADFEECSGDFPNCVDLYHYCVGDNCMEQEGIVSSVNTNTVKLNFKVKPNPVQDILNVETANFKQAVLYNLLGKKILQSNNPNIDISNLKKGIYLLKVLNNQNQTGIKKIIKI